MYYFRSQLDTKRIRLSSTTAKGVPSLIYADRSRIEHVFNNLVSNAIKFSDEDSEIRINLTYETDDSPVVRFSIRDFGKGIAPSDLAILFQPFTMIRPGELGEGRGSGLGLSICKVRPTILLIIAP